MTRRLLTHKKPTPQAGGIVVRLVRGQPRVLIVTTRRSRSRWVLPKGTVKKGETPRAAALREVREEAGVTGRVLGPADTAEYSTALGRVRIEYFLIEYRRQLDDEGEDRDARWCAVEDAIGMLTYASARRVLLAANARIVAHAKAARDKAGRAARRR